MSVMFEVYYRKPASSARELAIAALVGKYLGDVTLREDDSPNTICLTIEFPDWENAEEAREKLTELGEYVEGPTESRDR